MPRPPAPGNSIGARHGTRSASYELPANAQGQRRFQLHVSGFHYSVPDDVEAFALGNPTTYSESDFTFVSRGADWVVANAIYDVTVRKTQMNGITVRYISKRAEPAFAECTLTHLDDVALTGVMPTPSRSGGRLLYVDVAPGLDIEVLLRPTRVEVNKYLRNASAPRKLTWHYRVTDVSNILVPRTSGGVDNYDRSAPTRGPGFPGKYRRSLQMTHAVRNETVASGVREWDFDETWTGSTITRDPITREEVVVPDHEYPVWIDVPVSEIINDTTTGADDEDDGAERDSDLTWRRSYSDGAGDNQVGLDWTEWYVGFRFVSVEVPNATDLAGGVVDDATFKIRPTGVNGGTITSNWKGVAADNHAIWTDTNRPRNIALTSEGLGDGALNWTVLDGDGDVVIDVKAIVDEIVGRPGWVSGNAMSFCCSTLSGSGGGDHYEYLEDFGSTPPTPPPPPTTGPEFAARLVINYTLAPTGLPPKGLIVLDAVRHASQW